MCEGKRRRRCHKVQQLSLAESVGTRPRSGNKRLSRALNVVQLVCRRTCSSQLLESYSVERSAVGDQVLKAAGRLTAVATMKNHTAETLRNLVGRMVLGLAPVRRAMMQSQGGCGLPPEKLAVDETHLGSSFAEPRVPRLESARAFRRTAGGAGESDGSGVIPGRDDREGLLWSRRGG